MEVEFFYAGRRLAAMPDGRIFTHDNDEVTDPSDGMRRAAKLARAKAWLGTRYVFHPAYQPRLPVHASTLGMLRGDAE